MSGNTPLTDITQVDTINTFDDWRVLTNQTIARVNNAVSSNSDGTLGYSELVSRIVVRDNDASFVANDIRGNTFSSNTSHFFFANGEESHVNTSITNSGFYVGMYNTGNGYYGTNQVDPVTDPSGLRSLVCRTTDAILLPRGTTVQEPLNGEPGMIRFNTDLSSLSYYNPSTLSWKTLGGAELTDRDVDTIINVESAPGTDEDQINFFVGNTGSSFPIITMNADTVNTTINAIFKDYVRFDRDVTIAGNLNIIGTTMSIDSTSLAIEDKLINIGMVSGIRNKCSAVQDGPNVKIVMPVNPATGGQDAHSLQLDDLVWVTNINDIGSFTEGLYKVESIGGLYDFTIHNTDSSPIGAIVGSQSPELGWAGPQSDDAVSGGGIVFPGNTEHSLKWSDEDQYFTFSDNMRIHNTGAFGLPVGNNATRPQGKSQLADGTYTGVEDYIGGIRFNAERNTVECYIQDHPDPTVGTWVDVRGMIDSDDGDDTFINVYGNHTVPTAIYSSNDHTLNDIVFRTGGQGLYPGGKRFFIDARGYAHFTSNSGLILPKGTTAEQPAFPSADGSGGVEGHQTGDGLTTGMIRFNTTLNTYEGVVHDATSTDNLRFVPLGPQMVAGANNSANDTFISWYGNESDGFSFAPSGDHVGIVGNAAHTLDDVIVTVAGNKRLFIDSTGWVAFTSNGVMGLPRGTTAQRPSTVAEGLDAGFIRFNTSINSYEGVLADGTTWAGLGGVVDSANGGDTFIQVYGHASDATSIAPDSNHVYNDIVFVTASSEEMTISANGYIHAKTSANSVFVLPIGTTAQRPASADLGYLAGAIRFNTSLNSYEGVLADGTTWAGLGGVVDAADSSDTFINVYGHATNPTSITADTNHTLNDIVFTTAGTHRMTLDRAGNVVISSDGSTFIGNARLQVVGTMNVHSHVVFSSTFNVNGNVDFDSELNVDGHTELNSTLNVDGTSNFVGNVSFDDDIIVDGDTTLSGTTKIKGTNTAGANKFLRCNDTNGTVDWISFGVFNSAGTRVF